MLSPLTDETYSTVEWNGRAAKSYTFTGAGAEWWGRREKRCENLPRAKNAQKSHFPSSRVALDQSVGFSGREGLGAGGENANKKSRWWARG